MNKKILLDRIIKYLTYSDYEIPSSLDEKRKLWEELVCNNKKKLSKEILSDEDKYLRYELINRKLTDGEKVKTINDAFGINSYYGDRIALWVGSIDSIYVDAIVNFVNDFDNIKNNSDVSYNIFLKSGMRLRKKCLDIIGDVKLEDAEVFVTRAYNLPCDFIMHVYFNDMSNDILLKMGYLNVLECANNNLIKTIVFPIINSTDTKEFNICLRTIKEFLDRNKQIEKIILAISDNKNYEIYKNILLNE